LPIFLFLFVAFGNFGICQTTELPIPTLSGKVDSVFVTSEPVQSQKNDRIGTYLSQVINNSKNFAVQLGQLKLILSEFPDTLEMSERIPELQQSTATLE